jgi:glycerophosphoryl diester phosphodiesterase
MFKTIKDSTFLAFAHRGGNDFAPENTFESFQFAVENGFKYLETDVHPASDNKLMAFHDPTLDRVTNAEGRIIDFSSIDLKKVKVKNNYRIPLMEELLESFPNCFFSIDMKCDQSVKPLIDLVKRNNALERVCFASFNQNRLNFVRETFNNKCITSMGPKEIITSKICSYINLKKNINSHLASMPVSRYNIKLIDKKSVAYLQSLNIKVIAWTINNADQMRHLISIGVDGIMTDKLKLLKNILIEKNLWQ